MTKTQPKQDAPVERIRVKSVQGSIFANPSDKGTFFNTTFQNGYRDRDGTWKNGTSYSLNGLLALQHAVGLAIDKVLALQQAENSEQPEDDESEA